MRAIVPFLGMVPTVGRSIVPVRSANLSCEGGIERLPGIRVKDNESFESALRRFKKKCEKAGILSDLRKHQHFEKPSERRKRKENAARRKMQALQRSQQGY